MKNTTQSLKIITLALLFSFGLSYVYAWTAPTVTPTGGNVSVPINTSAVGQVKDGGFGVNGLLRGYGNAIVDGKVGIGTTNPYIPLVVYSSSANGSAVAVDRPAGLAGMYQVRTNGLARWVFGGNASLESGSNAGTDFQMISYNDSGLGEVNAVTIKRSTGNVGIGTDSPRAKLDVVGEIKIGNTSSVCNTTNEGQQRYNSASKSMEFCDGTTWAVIGMGSSHGVKAFTTIGTTSWTVPAGVTTVWVTAAGGGGGGGTGNNYNIPGAGGGGGDAGLYDKVTVVPGQDITIIVGNGGPGSTSVTSTSGGPGGRSCFGAVCYPGGLGATGSIPGDAGGPGGVKGGYGSPLYAYGYTGGVGGGTMIGAGGTTSDYPVSKNGVPGGLYGGGGGGGSTNGLGANGAQGGVFVIW